MSALSLPELPPLANLKRCPSQPAAPPAPGALPRHLVPPHCAGDPVADAVHQTRILRQTESTGKLEVSRSAGFSASGHLLLVPQHELPPLRCAVLNSRGSSRLHSSSLTRRPEMDLFYDAQLGGDNSKSSGQLCSRASTRGMAGRSALSQLDIAWIDAQDRSPASGMQDIEGLKRQASRLSHLRRDRDTFVKDFFTNAELPLRADSGEAPLGDRESQLDTLVAQQREHAAALAEQALRYERELSELRKALCKQTDLRMQERSAFRSQLRRRAMHSIATERDLWQRTVFDSWRSQCARSSRRCQSADEHGRQDANEETKLLQLEFRAALEDARATHLMHVSMRCWAAVAASQRGVRAEEQHLADLRMAAIEREELRAGFRSLLCHRAHQVVEMQVARNLDFAFICWVVFKRDAKKDATSRHQQFKQNADSIAELYRLRGEAKQTAQELRRQRRAHGVAAIHASLDRRLQAVVHAWSSAARDSQRESIYQRQLDIAAAESAAGCAVLRMENRRTALELRHARRVQALRAVRAGMRHWRHAVLYAWSVVVADERRENMIIEELALAAENIDSVRFQAQQLRSRMADCRGAQASALARLRRAHWATLLIQAWSSVALRSSRRSVSAALDLADRAEAVGASDVPLEHGI
mmetsp:Transcript_110803/g.320233  ORF Transcript_110803/g.320233 Transcript_110803/m.320233 type:complete len:644 (-) Transcript_110803:177-2108(-)